MNMRYKRLTEQLAKALEYEEQGWIHKVHKRNLIITRLREQESVIIADSIQIRKDNEQLRERVNQLKCMVEVQNIVDTVKVK